MFLIANFTNGSAALNQYPAYFTRTKSNLITVLLPQVLMPVSCITAQVPPNYSTVIFV
jgi:hypothetical protein